MTVTPTTGLIAGLVLIAVAKLCYLWGFKEGRRQTFGKSPLGTFMADPRVPRDTVLLVDDNGLVVGRMGHVFVGNLLVEDVPGNKFTLEDR